MDEHLATQDRLARLQELTHCSLERCREADAQGSLLSAILFLEAEGDIPAPSHQNQGFYSTKEEHHLPDFSQFTQHAPDPLESSSFLPLIRQEILENHFEIWTSHRYLARIPVFMLLLLFPLSYGGLFPLLLFPLFFGLHYRFSSSGSFLAEFNPIIRRIANTLHDLGRKFPPTTTKSEK